MFNNRKAQVGETVTWMVATIAIVVILVISVLIVSIGPFKNREFRESGTSDLLITKSFMGYLLTDDVWENVKDKKGFPRDPKVKLEQSNMDLAINIFPVLYSGNELNYIWLGIVDSTCKFGSGCVVSQIPFGERNKRNLVGKRFFYDNIKLNENSFIELVIKIKE